MAVTEDYNYEDNYEYEEGDDNLTVLSTGAAPCTQEDVWRFAQLYAPVVYPLVCALAILGNGLVLGVVWRYRLSRRGRSPYAGPCAFSLTDTFLLHLSLSDLLLALTLPFYAAQWGGGGGWVFGGTTCKLAGAAFSLNLYSGVLFLACISFDRYLAIVHALGGSGGGGGRGQGRWLGLGGVQGSTRAQLTCAVIWGGCLCLSLVDVYFRQVTPFPMVGGTVGLEGRLLCHRKFHWENSDHWRVGLQLLGLGLGFLVPLLVMLYCYTCIFRSLCLAPRPPTQRQRSLRLIISIVGVFLVCWGPYNGFLLTDSLQRLGVVGRSCALDKALDLGTLVSESLALAHCALNPLLYAFVGVKFRRELGHLGKEALGWCRGKSRRGGWGRRGWGSDGGGRGQRSTRVSERSLTASESESSAMYYSVMV